MNNLYTTTLTIAALMVIGHMQADSSDIVTPNNEQTQIPAQQKTTEAPSQSQEQTTSRKHHFHFFDDMFEEFEHSMQRMRDWHAAIADSYKHFDAKAIEGDKIPTVATTAEVIDEENQVLVVLTIGDAKLVLDPKSVDITTRDQQVQGTISIPNGKIDFIITHNGLFVTKHIEIKDETKKDDKMISSYINYSSSSLSRTFPALVDLASIKAEVKNNSLVLILGKKQYAKIPVTISTK